MVVDSNGKQATSCVRIGNGRQREAEAAQCEEAEARFKNI